LKALARSFEAPLGALVSVKDAEASLQQHKCDRKDVSQPAGRILKGAR